VWHLEGISRAREKRKSDRVKQVEEESTRLVGGQMRGRRVEVSFSQERKGKEKKDFGIFKFWWRYERVPRQDNASPERPYRAALYIWPKTKAPKNAYPRKTRQQFRHDGINFIVPMH
jgi:hypothetical protein